MSLVNASTAVDQHADVCVHPADDELVAALLAQPGSRFERWNAL